MPEHADLLRAAVASGETVGLATVVRTWRSAPRAPGSSMLVRADGTVAGSVSGGCIDSDVYETAVGVLATGEACLRSYGEASPLEIGVPCGGEIEVFVERLTPDRAAVLLAAADTGATMATVVASADPARLGARELRKGLGASLSCLLDEDGEQVFVEAGEPPARLIVCGATEHAAALTRLGGFLGRHVTVVDPRPVFATPQRFPAADEVVVAWPQEYLAAEADAGRLDDRTAVVVAGHDPRTEVPTLAVALGLGLGYVGALGSRRTHDLRLAELREAGVAVGGLHSPAGLDLGGRSPEETALSIAAEIVASAQGGTGQPLRDRRGPIHR